MVFFRETAEAAAAAREARACISTSRLKHTRERHMRKPSASMYLPIASLVPDASRDGHERAPSAEGGNNQKPNVRH